jgi:hydroxymethylpyrimidine pyrophosphatase-like HAD family hydrolase
MALIALDFDHTIVDGDVVRDYAREAINIWRENGHKVVIHSCNNPRWIEKVLRENRIVVDHIWDEKGKLLADIYVDDKGYRYEGNWRDEVDKVLHLVEGLDNRKW